MHGRNKQCLKDASIKPLSHHPIFEEVKLLNGPWKAWDAFFPQILRATLYSWIINLILQHVPAFC